MLPSGARIKYGLIDVELRRRIVSGSIRPGGRLPTLDDLQVEFGTTRSTIVRAVGQLKRDGFLRVGGRAGTFVVDRPPHLCHYGLVFSAPSQSSQELTSRFLAAVTLESQRIARQRKCRVSTYYDVSGHVDVEDYTRLRVDLRAQRLAGLIFADPFQMQAVVRTLETSVPTVCLTSWAYAGEHPGVFTDELGMYRRAMAEFVRRGRQRLAVIASSAMDHTTIAHIEGLAAGAGMEMRAYWVQSVDCARPWWGASCARLLLDGPPDARPDALLITDDHLVEHATRGVVETGVRVPDELDVIGHCNFPWQSPSAMPVRRLGFDVREIVEACFDWIDTQRGGAAISQSRSIAPLFEEEIRRTPPAPGEAWLSLQLHDNGAGENT